MSVGILLTTACDPMDDIHSEVDAQESYVVGDANYTLTAADYTTLKLNFGSFNTEADAKTMIPGLLTKKYPVWGKGSSVLANYKLYIGNAPGVSDFTGATQYSLTQANYALSGSTILGFYPNVTAKNYLANSLATGISSPVENQIALVKYVKYNVTPTITTTTNFSLDENFSYGATAGAITAVSGGKWASHSGTTLEVGYTNTSLSMAGYPSTGTAGSIKIVNNASEDVNTSLPSTISSGNVYLSTLINLNTVGTGNYFFHFMDDAFGFTARVGAKDNGSGKILFGIGANSSTLTYGTTAFDLNTTYLLVASYNIDSGVSNLYVLTAPTATEPTTPEATNSGNPSITVQRVGIRNGGSSTSTTSSPSATFDGIRVAKTWNGIMINDIAVSVTGDKTNHEVFYTYTSGSWKESTGVIFLSDADFDSMGEGAGQPGQYNNFSSSIAPDDYLPTFLKLKYPYAKEKDKLFVIYDYFSSSSGASIRGNLYTFTSGVWLGHQSTITTTLKFGHDGATWVPDNTIKYTLVRDDYNFIGTSLETVSGYAIPAGSAKQYGNFDRRSGNAAYWSTEMLERAMDLLLTKLVPTAAIGQKYAMSYAIYNGAAGVETITMIKNDAGKWVANK